MAIGWAMDGSLSPRCPWLLRTLALCLVVIHVILTWQLFGSHYEPLLEETPLIEGQHARLLYYGEQVAQAVRLKGIAASVYDPRIQAGLTISPWASIESRLALFAFLTVPDHPLATYKLLLLFTWLSLPISLWLMCRICNLSSGAITAALLLFLGCAWSPWGVQLIKQGETDVIIGSAAMGIALGFIVRSYARPRWWTKPGLFLSMTVSVYFWPATLILLLVCFILFLGLLAGRLPWPRFLGLVFAFFASLAINAFWMRECWRTWWMIADRETLLPSSWHELFNLKSNLQLMIWPGLLLVIGFLGTRTLRTSIGGRSALVWSLGIVLTAGAALLPQEIETFHLDKLHGWWWCSVWLATVPVGKLIAYLLTAFCRLVGGTQRGILVMTVLLGTLGVLFREELARGVVKVEEIGTLHMQTPAIVYEVVHRLRQHTTDDARILWEETKTNAAWAPLLPRMIDRFWVGSLGRAEQVLLDPLQVRLVEGSLLSKPMEQWRISDLNALANDWNIGWVVAFHPESILRWKAHPSTEVVAELPNGGRLFRLNRPFTYCKQGQAQWSFTAPRRLTLTNLVPENGHVVLSLHCHTTMRSMNNKAILEKWQQAFDSVPMLKIRLPGPMERLTIEW